MTQYTTDMNYLASQASAIILGSCEDSLSDAMVCVEKKASALAKDFCIQIMKHALESLDERLYQQKQSDIFVTKKEQRTLVTVAGNLSYTRRMYKDSYQNTRCLLDEQLEIPKKSRLSPLARDYIVESGARTSYSESAKIFALWSGADISPTCVMNSVRSAAQKLKDESLQKKESLFLDGVAKKGKIKTKELFIEADATYVAKRAEPGEKRKKPQKIRINTACSYTGKQKCESKVRRCKKNAYASTGSVMHFKQEVVADIVNNYDINALETIHIGTDGEACLKDWQALFAFDVNIVHHLDLFHVKRKLKSCFPTDASNKDNLKNKEINESYYSILECLDQADITSAIYLLKTCVEKGIVSASKALEFSRYIYNNRDGFHRGSPSLGTQEADNQRLIKRRMGSFPLGWSKKGADAVARLRAHLENGKPLPKQSYSDGISKKELKKRQRRIDESLEAKPFKVLKYVGKGYEYPIQGSLKGASAEVRYAAGLYQGHSQGEY